MSLSSSFSSFFLSLFSFLHFLETGKDNSPPPQNGHARILVNAEIYGRSLRAINQYATSMLYLHITLPAAEAVDLFGDALVERVLAGKTGQRQTAVHMHYKKLIMPKQQ